MVELLEKFVTEPSGQHRSLVRSRIQRMLKHDWERAKIEAKVFPYFADARAAAELRRQDRRYGSGDAMRPR
ncbi:hypothetical protein ACIP5T_10870 [Microbacterium sp. NPDC088619]|uniref:hypothetical protein n=1 Tax=Microbacterium sp. NPDC088619 TaxID=3364196 RepID=UPI00380D75BB